MGHCMFRGCCWTEIRKSIEPTGGSRSGRERSEVSQQLMGTSPWAWETSSEQLRQLDARGAAAGNRL